MSRQQLGTDRVGRTFFFFGGCPKNDWSAERLWIHFYGLLPHSFQLWFSFRKPDPFSPPKIDYREKIGYLVLGPLYWKT